MVSCRERAEPLGGGWRWGLVPVPIACGQTLEQGGLGWGGLSAPGSSESEFQEEGAGSRARQGLGPPSPQCLSAHLGPRPDPLLPGLLQEFPTRPAVAPAWIFLPGGYAGLGHEGPGGSEWPLKRQTEVLTCEINGLKKQTNRVGLFLINSFHR